MGFGRAWVGGLEKTRFAPPLVGERDINSPSLPPGALFFLRGGDNPYPTLSI